MYYYVSSKEKNEEIIESDQPPKMANQIGGIYHMLAGPYESVQKAIEVNRVHENTCSVCNGLIGLRFHKEINNVLIKKEMCFNCSLWDDRANNIEERHMVVNHCFYSIADENTRSPIGTKGFGGRKFSFIKNGNLIESTNVWYGGDIPERFWDRIPDNASLI